MISVFGSFSIEANIAFRKSSETCTGNKALFSALFLKMSAKKLDTTTLNPKS
jgi:hypothetical protein